MMLTIIYRVEHPETVDEASNREKHCSRRAYCRRRAFGTYVYSPWSSLEWFTLLNQIAIVALLSLSGLSQGHRLIAASNKRT